MKTATKNITLSFLILIAVVVIALYFSGGLERLQGRIYVGNLPAKDDAASLAIKGEIPRTDARIFVGNLGIQEISNSNTIGFGTERVVGGLELSSSNPDGFTIRYGAITFESNGYDRSGFELPSKWKAYLIRGGEVDYNTQVAEGVQVEVNEDNSGTVRLRFFSERNTDAGYATNGAKVAIVIDVIGAGAKEDVSFFRIKAKVDSTGSEGFNWSWAPGLNGLPWTLVESKFGESNISF